MSEISVLLQDRKEAYRPGETVRGTAYWTLGGQPESVEVRLFWRTEGKGSTDTEIAASKTFQNPARTDRRDFELVLPDGPFSYAGKLIAILWSVEVVAEPDSEAGHQDIVVSPTGQPVRPAPLPETPK
jgi:hypothetical protein